MQPLQYDLRDPAAKDNSITNAATARSNLDAAITMRSAETELQNTIELRATASEIVAPKPGSRCQSEKKTILKHFLKGLLDGKSVAPKWRKSADKSLSQPSCSHSNTIYEVQLQKTVVLRMQPKQEATLTQPLQCDLQRLSCKPQSHLHCGNDPTVAKQNGIPSATHPPATLAIPFTLRERSYSCKSQWNAIGNSSTSTTCNPIYIAGTILQLQITMEFCRPHMHEKQSPFTMRNRSEHDPTMIRPHTRQSRNCRTAEVDHRGSGTDFVWKNIGFRASAISQKRISCETSFKTPSATHPPAPLAMPCALRGDPTVANQIGIPSATHPPAPLAIPFTLRERSYSCKSQWNSVDRTCTKNR